MARGGPPPPDRAPGSPSRVRRADPRHGDPQRHARFVRRRRRRRRPRRCRSARGICSRRRARTSSTSAARAPGPRGPAKRSPAEVELARVLPVIRELAGTAARSRSASIRAKPSVAAAALDAGATIVNDVWGLRGDPRHGRGDRRSSRHRRRRDAQPGRNRIRRPHGGRLPRTAREPRSRREGRHPAVPGDHRPGLRLRQDARAQPRADAAPRGADGHGPRGAGRPVAEVDDRTAHRRKRTRSTVSNRALRLRCSACRRVLT